MNIRFAVAMAVGPKEVEMTLDTLDSVYHYYPNADIWIVDDHTQDGTYEKLQSWAKGKPHCHLLRNPAANKFVYLFKSIATLFAAIAASHEPYKFVLKIDTDTLLVDKGLDEVVMARLGNKGACGDYLTGASGSPRDHRIFTRKLFLDRFPIRYTPKFKHWRLGAAEYIPYLRQAKKHGYMSGKSVFGGGYAIHGSTINAMAECGYFEMLLTMGPCLVYEEDLIFSLGVAAVGHPLMDIELDKATLATRTTWLDYGSELRVAEEFLDETNVKIIHPLKNTEKARRIRRHYRLKRQ